MHYKGTHARVPGVQGKNPAVVLVEGIPEAHQNPLGITEQHFRMNIENRLRSLEDNISKLNVENRTK